MQILHYVNITDETFNIYFILTHLAGVVEDTDCICAEG